MSEIKNRWDGSVMCAGETVRDAAEANRADLWAADLRGADLRAADLRGAKLRAADLRGANLTRASLMGADLMAADLRGADLRAADLRGAKLRAADLWGAAINWQSHDLLSELLRRAAGGDIEKLKVAGLLLVARHWCWDTFVELAASDPLGPWALDTLASYLQDVDSVPHVLRDRKAKLEVEVQL